MSDTGFVKGRELLRHRSLLAILVAEVISTTGAQMTWLALPWFVLVTSGSATKMGAVAAAELAGVALCGIPGGSLVARLGARRTLLACDVARGPLVAAVPLLHWSGGLSFPVLLVLVFAVGGFSGPSFAARGVVIPEILGEEEALVSAANAFLQAATRVTLLLGPVLAGLLIGIIGASSVLIVDAATYAVSALLIFGFVPPGRKVEPGDADRGLLVGLRFLFRDRLLRAWSVTISVGDAGWNALFAALPFYAFTRYHGDARVAGGLLACFGVAAVAGNALSFRVRRRVEGQRLLAYGCMLQAAPLWLLVAAGPAWVVALALLLSGLANGVVNPTLHAFLTLRPPAAVRAQVLSAVMTTTAFAGPAGFLLAGPVLQRWGVGPVFVGVAVIQTLAMGSRAVATLRRRESTESSAGPRGFPEPG